jgi:prepilin-type N-terminal cleavage/methylation domain-containing protein
LRDFVLDDLIRCPSISAERQVGRRWQRAFSLLELVAVILLLGIVTAAVITRLSSIDNSTSRNNVVNDNLAVLQTAVEQFYFDKGLYPADISDLVAGGYISAAPKVLHPGKQYTIGGDGVVVYQ